MKAATICLSRFYKCDVGCIAIGCSGSVCIVDCEILGRLRLKGMK